jgi:hypothetical protein
VATFHAALRAKDVAGVEAALKTLARVDPGRAQNLIDATHVALDAAGGSVR